MFSHPVMSDAATSWTAASLSVPHHLLKFAQVHVHVRVMPSSHLILWHPLLLLPSIFPSIRDFSNELFTSDDQNTGALTSTSVLPMSIQGWFPLRLTDLISVLSRGLSGIFSSTTVGRHQFSALCLFYSPALTIVSDHWEDHSLDYMDLFQQSNVSAFQHTKFVIAFLPRNNHLLISWLQSPSAVILEPKRKSVTTSTFSPSICHEVMEPDAMILIFLIFSFKPAFSLSSRGSLVSLHPHQEALYFLFVFCHWCGIIWISEVVDVSPTYLDSSL